MHKLTREKKIKIILLNVATDLNSKSKKLFRCLLKFLQISFLKVKQDKTKTSLFFTVCSFVRGFNRFKKFELEKKLFRKLTLVLTAARADFKKKKKK